MIDVGARCCTAHVNFDAGERRWLSFIPATCPLLAALPFTDADCARLWRLLAKVRDARAGRAGWRGAWRRSTGHAWVHAAPRGAPSHFALRGPMRRPLVRRSCALPVCDCLRVGSSQLPVLWTQPIILGGFHAYSLRCARGCAPLHAFLPRLVLRSFLAHGRTYGAAVAVFVISNGQNSGPKES